ncbi:MAG: TonB family protein [Flavobacteriales bacterium]|nr:TonB family protein [Flavobacteriales bacterium]
MFRPVLTLLLALSSCLLRAQGFVPCAPYGGEQAVEALFEQELCFPQADLERQLKGSVYLIFSVMADGEVRDLRVWRPLTPACDAEALRLGRLVRWHPALLGDEPRAAEHYLEVPFDAKRYLRQQEVRRCLGGYRSLADSSLRIHTPGTVHTPPSPMIPDGTKGLPAYIAANLRYPEAAYKRDLQGTVRLDFVIEPSGSVSNLRALDEVGGGCNAEAMRLVRSICWSPATFEGRRVRCVQQLTIRFQIPARLDR